MYVLMSFTKYTIQLCTVGTHTEDLKLETQRGRKQKTELSNNGTAKRTLKDKKGAPNSGLKTQKEATNKTRNDTVARKFQIANNKRTIDS